MCGEEAGQGFFVADVGIDELGIGMESGEVPRDETVEDGDFVAGGYELIDGDATDVAGAANDEDLQGSVLEALEDEAGVLAAEAE